MIYLDNNATTCIDPEVLKAMQAYEHLPLNPSSVHHYGKLAKQLLTQAREDIAAYLGVKAHELFFTSGGTESMNLLLEGLKNRKGTILTTQVEHACIHEHLLHLGHQGISIKYIPVNARGAPSLEDIQSHLNQEISCMVFSAVYSETGAKLDLEGVARLAYIHQIPLIIDGVGLLGKEIFKIPQGVTGMGFSSHKLHGPKGVGLIFSKTPLQAFMFGGHQENGLRPGTENLIGIIGFAKAVDLLNHYLPQASEYMLSLRDAFETTLKQSLDIQINGSGARICNTSNITFKDIDGETLLLALDRHGVCASLGAACSSGAIEPSRVLLNMGLPRALAKASLRFSFSRQTTLEETKKAAQLIVELALQQQMILKL